MLNRIPRGYKEFIKIGALGRDIQAWGGQVELLGQDVTNRSQPRRIRAGLGRSNQRNTIYPSFRVA